MLSAVLEFVRPLLEGRIFPPLKPSWFRDLLQVRFASACLALLWQMRRMNPLMGQEGQPCWGSATSWAAPGPPMPPRLCLLHWPSYGHGTLRTPHQQPQQSSHTKFWLLLGTTRLEECQGSGGKSSSLVPLKLALTNALSKKLCCKSLIWKGNNSFRGSPRFLFIVQNINAWLIPKITAVGIFSP